MTRFSDLLRQAADAYDTESQRTVIMPAPFTPSGPSNTTASPLPASPITPTISTAAEKPGDPMAAQPVDLPTIMDIKFRRAAGVGGGDWIRIMADGLKPGYGLAIVRTDNPPNSETYPTSLEVVADGSSAVNTNTINLPAGTYICRLTDPVTYHTGPWAPFTVS